MLDFEPIDARSSRAFPVDGATGRMPAGTDPEWLKRWNGADEPIADGAIKGAALRAGATLMWVDKPNRARPVGPPLGRGEALLTTLHIQGRIDPKGPRDDPAADRILRNLVGP